MTRHRILRQGERFVVETRTWFGWKTWGNVKEAGESDEFGEWTTPYHVTLEDAEFTLQTVLKSKNRAWKIIVREVIQ